jgi:hypothetical protein
MFGWISYPTVPFAGGVATGFLLSPPVAWSIVLTTLATSCALIWLVHDLAAPLPPARPEAAREQEAA